MLHYGIKFENFSGGACPRTPQAALRLRRSKIPAYNTIQIDFKYNSSVFGLGTTNCSKTDRKQIYIAVYKSNLTTWFLFTMSTILFPIQSFVAPAWNSLESAFAAWNWRKSHKLKRINTNWRMFTRAIITIRMLRLF